MAAMRNDARPIGEASPASTVGGDAAPVPRPQPSGDAQESPTPDERPDSRSSVKHDRQSHIVHEQAEGRGPDNANDPVMPSNDATLNTRI
jgi:hypothetical protein